MDYIGALNKMHNEIEKNIREEKRKERNNKLKELHAENEVNHFKRQKEILLMSLENAKNAEEKYKYEIQLTYCNKNLSRWIAIKDNQQNR